MTTEGDHRQRRVETVTEIERSRIRLFTLSTQIAAAVQETTGGLWDLLDDALSPLSATRVLQSGVMYWAKACKAQTALVQGAWQTLMTPPRPPRERSRIIDGRITFFMDQFSEVSDPVVTQLSRALDIEATDLTFFGGKMISKECVAFSSSSPGPDSKYLVSIRGTRTKNLRDYLAGLPLGTYSGRVMWKVGAKKRWQEIRVILSRSPE